MEDVEN